ncbi:MAG: DUF389 domain-containing protein [Solirubrobacteraceae bacterium]
MVQLVQPARRVDRLVGARARLQVARQAHLVAGTAGDGTAPAPGRVHEEAPGLRAPHNDRVLHFRIVSPRAGRDAVLRELLDGEGVTNVVLLSGAAKRPDGDLFECDVAREVASRLLDRLRELRVDDGGSITVQALESTFSRSAREAEAAAPGFAVDAVVWQEIDQYAADESAPSLTFLAFLAIATQIAAIGVINDSPILIVGAMVLGPEFGPIAAICIGLYRRDRRRVLAALWTLTLGFAVAIAITCLCALVSRRLGLISEASLGHQIQTGFIVHPDVWSFIVAVLAAAAGILSLTAARTTTLVGVFISVTTVPAAGNAAVAIALGQWGQLAGSAEQLGVNVAAMLVSGTLTLLVVRAAWSLVPERRRHAVRHRMARRRRAVP